MKIHSLALLVFFAAIPRLDTCTNESASQETLQEVPFKELKALKLTKSDLSEIPNFRMPKGSFWAAMKLPPDQMNRQREFVQKGNTYFPIRTLVENVDYKQITEQQGIDFLNSLPKGTGLYEMLGDDDMCKIQGPLHGLWTNPVTVTPQDVRNYLNQWWNSRAGRFGWGKEKLFFDLDLEGFPAAWKNTQVLCDGLKLVRQDHPSVEFAMFATGMANLYPDGDGSEKNPYGQVGGDRRHAMYKNAGCTYYEMMPYAHYDEQLIGQGKPYANTGEYAQKSSLHLYDVLRWLDQRVPYVGNNYKGMSWVWSQYEGGQLEMIAPHIIESLPLWFLVTGAGKSGGGLCNWNAGNVPLNKSDFALEAGKWRASQFNQFWENPKTDYNIKIEYSLDNGKTWTNDEKTWMQDESYSWGLRRVVDNPKPIGVRAALIDRKLLVVATHRPNLAEDRVQNILCRYQGKVWPLRLPYHQVVTGVVSL